MANVRAAEKALEAIMIDFKKRSSVNVRLREKKTGPEGLLKPLPEAMTAPEGGIPG